MKSLMNFSLHESDLSRFENDWNNIESFLRTHGLDGVELFVDHTPLPDFPYGVVKGVHLPYWMGRHRAWVDEKAFHEDMDENEKFFLFGGHDRQDMIANFINALKNAASVNAEYGVFHVAYVELDHVFTRDFGVSDMEVMDSTAEFLNRSVSLLPGGEPPVRLFFENLWWPGLNLLDTAATMHFIDSLEFGNWAFTLDTGHLMNAIMNCTDEKHAIGSVLEVLARYPEDIIDRIEGMHFHCSLSGDYQMQVKINGVPAGYYDLSFHERLIAVMEHVSKIDQHMPFTDERCREIVDFVKPRFLTHEFETSNLPELEWKLRTQIRALCGEDR
ncbi:TIM barrel protein [uncultured Methanomethylovorans sp.]|jgi:hypothetical protein|uniref:TIM barrel protein n=1 Tax=uncultured Methanomethylovorans sp. TaxID=183759 RepID=UPI002604D243|nr:TIM barrel protein [uncultured Methanomethylovorans sp.]